MSASGTSMDNRHYGRNEFVPIGALSGQGLADGMKLVKEATFQVLVSPKAARATKAEARTNHLWLRR
jgi:hypothetical protein